jgi:RNA polymerase sigma-32 factor
LNELGPFRPLAREEEAALWHKWTTNGDIRARDELVRPSLHYVVRNALRLRGYRIAIRELISEGNLGIACALQKFDLSRGCRFATYAAYWIRAHMLQHVIRSYSIVSTESGPLRSQVFFRLRREKARIQNLMGETEVASEALAQRLKLSMQQLQEYEQRLTGRDASLHEEPQGGGVPLIDVLPSPAENQEDAFRDCQLRANMSERLRSAFEQLDRRERFIVESSLMCDDQDSLSLAELGRQLGVSRERARQLGQRAVKKLRQQLQGAFTTGYTVGSFCLS